MELVYAPGFTVPPHREGHRYLTLCDDKVVVREDDPWAIWYPRPLAEPDRAFWAGTLPMGELVVHLVAHPPAGTHLIPGREILMTAPTAAQAPLSAALGLANWFRNERFCSRCSAPLTDSLKDRALFCTGCDYRAYPRVSPCVIALVHRGDEVLLGRSRRHKRPMYSLLAGFVESGESLESAVAREVSEESGVQVGKVCYRGSQPWPFPHQLMAGFWAEWEAGELKMDEEELVDLRWFSVHELPIIPPPATIAWQLIHDYCKTRGVQIA
ncbi:NAD(+) diphosphatase [Hahella sp. SMD15-11]|uniref:NAD(+) diphosphatase n=1 Tax=Thermohahella caldifontis TaxID=3142973 RepID=A0AB39UVX2_9GAMM